MENNEDLDFAPETPYEENDDVVISEDTDESLIEDDEVQEEAEEAAKPEETDDKITLSKKDYELMKETNRQSTQEAQKLLWVDRVRTDKYDFIKLYESDRSIAERVLQHVGEEKDPRLLYNELRKEKYGEDDKEVQKAELLDAIEQKEIKKEFNRILKANGLDLESKAGLAFKEEYDFLTDNGKRVTSENVESFTSKAMKLAWVKDIAQMKAKTDKELLGAGNSTKATNTTTTKEKWSFFDQFNKGGPSKWY